MKKRTYTFKKAKLARLLMICLSFTTTVLLAQPTNVTVTGCSAGATVNGDYTLIATICNSCSSYERTGGGVFIFREQTGSNLWAAGLGSINCNTIPYAMQSGETDCDPTNGGSSVNGCIIAETVLPVEMIWFDAEAKDKNTIKLGWEVASESNNEGFEIERSTDGILFRAIGFVEGRGDASDAMEYEYHDKGLTTGKVFYYRLKQIDFDGQFEYFDIVSVALKSEKTVLGEFYPNPSSGLASIDLYTKRDKEWSVEAFDLSGKVILNSLHSLTGGKNTVEFDFSAFETGLYFIKFENDAELIYRKLSIQKN